LQIVKTIYKLSAWFVEMVGVEPTSKKNYAARFYRISHSVMFCQNIRSKNGRISDIPTPVWVA